MIIYKIQESGRATDFTLAKKCPNGWLFIPPNSKTGILPDKIPGDKTPFHEQKYLDYLASIEYAENRTKEYPSIGDQLDYIYHNGLTAWKTSMIKPVKDKYPKPI